ncbi:unnamed protein product [Parajaminaea phylloscopi]
MPPARASAGGRREGDAGGDDDDFLVPDDYDDDSGDDFMAGDDADYEDGRHFAAARKKAATAAAKAKKATSATKGGKILKAGSKDASKSYAWESNFQRSWDVVGEDESGSLEASVKHLLAAGKRKRAAREERRVRRGIIRHLVLVIDDSDNMNEKDGGRGRRIDVLLPIARRFVVEYFEQNPIGQLAILVMKDGVAERLVPMGGNTADHLAALNNRRRMEPRGDPSLQNALEMAKSTLAHLPVTSSREVLLLSGSLTSCDPGNIHHTVASLKASNIRVDLIHLTAEMKIMRDVAQETGGTFGVALDDGHLEELIREGVRPREIIKKEKSEPKTKPISRQDDQNSDEDDEDDDGAGAELMQMGFPLRLPTHAPPALCACHARLYPPTSGDAGGGSRSTVSASASAGFLCPRCGVKICDVPTDCPVCGLTVVMSTHLARSYRHLFPIRRWSAVTWDSVAADPKVSASCRGCDELFPPLPADFVPSAIEPPDAAGSGNGRATTGQTTSAANGNSTAGPPPAATLAPSSRYECPKCHSHFCLECDSYVHEELFVCPGCG